jgi:AAA family ATP:ADP antiporter
MAASSSASWFEWPLEVRPGEGRLLFRAFASLLVILGAYTILETARDALLLTELPPRALGAIYVLVAAFSFPSAAVVTRATARFGTQRSLTGGLALLAVCAFVLFLVPPTRVTVVIVYVATSLVGPVFLPQFWQLIGSVLTVAQGRRLLGPISGAGVLGSAVGAAAAASMLAVVHTQGLLAIAALLLAGAAAIVASIPAEEAMPAKAAVVRGGASGAIGAIREEPFLGNIALLVVVSTAATFLLDYFFKWTVARSVPAADIPRLVARYYAALNAFALVSQLFVSSALVRRNGAANTLLVTPVLLLVVAIATLGLGGPLYAVLLLKGFDGTMRSPIHRVTTELLYLPVTPSVRARAKPYIDGSMARVTQALVGAILFAVAGMRHFSPITLAALVTVLLGGWLLAAARTRNAYFGLLRRAVSGISTPWTAGMDPLAFETAEELVETLANDDPLLVIGAMDALARRGRGRLIPALVLLHPDATIIKRALDLFAESERNDWVSLGRKLLASSDESVRMAAARALAMHGRLDAADLTKQQSPRFEGYATLSFALGRTAADALEDPRVNALLERTGAEGDEAHVGMLSAIADSPKDSRVAALLFALDAIPVSSREWTEAFARAVAAQGMKSLAGALVERLPLVDARETVTAALVQLGAIDEVWAVLRDPSQPKALRSQLPQVLSRFGTARAAALLLECIETGPQGSIRWKAIRGLGRLVSTQGITVDRARVLKQAYRNLLEHFRLLGIRAPFETERTTTDEAQIEPTERLLLGLLDDKIRLSLARVFRLLKIAYPTEDLHKVHTASLSDDKRARANAAELLETLLRGREQQQLRTLLLLVADDLPIQERVKRAAPLMPTPAPATRRETVDQLIADPDPFVAALATLYDAAHAGTEARVVVEARSQAKKNLELVVTLRHA